jgi:hypothetical protein
VGEYKALDAELRGNSKEPGCFYGKNAVIEEFSVSSKLVKKTMVDVPKEIMDRVKAEHGEKREYEYYLVSIDQV